VTMTGMVKLGAGIVALVHIIASSAAMNCTD